MIDYKRLQYLNRKVTDKTATKAERDEYMSLLYKSGNVTKNQYDEYKNNNSNNADNILGAAVTIGGIVLLGYLIGKIVEKK